MLKHSWHLYVSCKAGVYTSTTYDRDPTSKLCAEAWRTFLTNESVNDFMQWKTGGGTGGLLWGVDAVREATRGAA